MEQTIMSDVPLEPIRQKRSRGEIAFLAGCIAGTPVDTRMGLDCLRARGIPAIGLAASATPEAQSTLQVLAPEALTRHVEGLIRTLSAQGADGIMIYCNSMSGAIDLPYLREATGMKIITPLDVYRELASALRRPGVMAANNQSLAGIERTLQQSNPACWPIGFAQLPVVVDIEAGRPAGEIVAGYKLRGVVEAMQAFGAEALILGCTHFPYLKAELKALQILPIIDPADRMIELLLAD